MVDKKMLDRAINKTTHWLLHSGIQNIHTPTFMNGGFNGWYDGSKYPLIYSEITGYGIVTLMYLYSLDPQKIFLERAKLAYQWLRNIASHEFGGVKTRYYLYDTKKFDPYAFEQGPLCSFDSAMCLYSLCLLYQQTKNRGHLKFAKTLGEFLLKLQRENGSFYAIYNVNNKKFIDTTLKWSTQSGSFHAKNALGLYQLYEITKDSRYRQSAKKVCDYVLNIQTNKGGFISHRQEGWIHFHPHVYTLEGLIFMGDKLKQADYFEAVKKGIIWSFEHQFENGGIPSIFWNGIYSGFERLDVLAQTLRIGLLAYDFGLLDDSYLPKFDDLLIHILTFQVNDRDEHKNGGFRYGFEETGKRLDHINSWCTMFGLQAMIMYKQKVGENKSLSVDCLI